MTDNAYEVFVLVKDNLDSTDLDISIYAEEYMACIEFYQEMKNLVEGGLVAEYTSSNKYGLPQVETTDGCSMFIMMKEVLR